MLNDLKQTSKQANKQTSKQANKQTSKQANKYFIASIILNILFLIVLSFAIYYARYSIINRFKPLFEKVNNLETNVDEMNPKPFIRKKEYININNAKENIDVLVLGNSLSLHGTVEGLWPQESGMAASKSENDYIHVLMKEISKNKNVGINLNVVNIAEFERNFKDFNFDVVSDLQSINPQYVIFQIGENVSRDEIAEYPELFKNKYIKLVGGFDNAVKIVCLPFWPDKNKNNIITDVGIQTGSFIVDLSHLGSGLDEKNLAESENKYDHPGVAAHPGDYGMKNIAMNVYSVFNAILKNKN